MKKKNLILIACILLILFALAQVLQLWPLLPFVIAAGLLEYLFSAIGGILLAVGAILLWREKNSYKLVTIGTFFVAAESLWFGFFSGNTMANYLSVLVGLMLIPLALYLGGIWHSRQLGLLNAILLLLLGVVSEVATALFYAGDVIMLPSQLPGMLCGIAAFVAMLLLTLHCHGREE